MSRRDDPPLGRGATSDPTSSDLIARVVADLTPVKPVSFGRSLASCWLVSASTALVTVCWLGARSDLAARATEAGFIASMLALGLGAVLSAAAAIRGGIPGREVRFGSTLALLSLPLALAAGVVVLSPTRSAGWPTWLESVGGGWPCIATTAGVAILPWLAAVYLLNRLHCLREVRSAALAALAACFLGAFVSHLRCAAADAHHVAAAHYLPVLALAGVGCALAVLASRRRRTLLGG